MNKHKKKVVACIIVRMNSVRLPEKAMLDIYGKPMTERLIDRIKKANTIDEIVLCTSDHPDDSILIKLAERCNIKSFAGSQNDVLSRLIDVAIIYKADVLIRITGDNIFTDPDYIDQMVRHHIETDADYTRTNNLPLGVTAEVLSSDILMRLYKLIPDPGQSEYLTLWAFDPDKFHCVVLEAAENVNRYNYSLTVDTNSDLELVKRLYKDLSKSEAGPELKDIIPVLDSDNNYNGINDNTSIKLPAGENTTFGDLISMYRERAKRAKKLNQLP